MPQRTRRRILDTFFTPVTYVNHNPHPLPQPISTLRTSTMDDILKPAFNSGGGGPISLADPAMLEKIDKLFACNVGDYIDLPQIVVVGDQSSGKSSALEGLTDLPFPRDSGLCTRFATQITFRRSASRRIAVSIVAAKTSKAEHVEKVRAWAKERETLDQKAFADIMREVCSI